MQMAGVLIWMCCTNNILWLGGGVSLQMTASLEIDVESTDTAALRNCHGNPDQRECELQEFLSVFITTTQLCQTLRPKVNELSRGIR